MKIQQSRNQREGHYIGKYGGRHERARIYGERISLTRYFPSDDCEYDCSPFSDGF